MLSTDLIAETRKLRLSGALRKDGSFLYVVFTGSVSMRPIVRRSAEHISATVTRRAHEFDVIINGNYFGADKIDQFQALIGITQPTSDTRIEGRVVRAGLPTIGDSRPERFYIEEIAEPGAKGRPGRLRYVTGRGDPPPGKKVVSGLGNVGPMISGNLPYGMQNRYSGGVPGPPTGDPGPKFKRSLIQRNDNTFRSVSARTPATGKTVIAFHDREQALMIGVQPDGHQPGQTYDALRDDLIHAGFSDAIFLDGSDSSMLWHRGKCIVAPGPIKDGLMTVALGFRPYAKKH